MRILFVCGGTAGHINPALAVADIMAARHKGCKILFAGSPKGMEATLVPSAGYSFVPIEVAGFQRRLSGENISRNIKALYLLALSAKRAKRIIRDFKPDIVMGTGGYVTGPVVRAAAKMAIPTATHEQNAFPGITTKLLSPLVDKVLLAFSDAGERLKCKNPPITTGNPVRGALLKAGRDTARNKLNIAPDKLCILSFGGSLGAAPVNAAVAALMLSHRGKYHHIHATGRQNHAAFTAIPGIASLPMGSGIDIRPYIEDMDDCLAAADLVICRAGALTLSELTAVGRASILIPSPYVAENHQYHNAMALVNAGAADILEEKNLTGESLIAKVTAMLDSPDVLLSISRRAALLGLPKAGEHIADELEGLIRGR